MGGLHNEVLLFYGKGAIAKKPITWGKMREVRAWYLGSKCELSELYGEVVMHHGYYSFRPATSEVSGRQQSIFDGQLRSRASESFMHCHHSAGNSVHSMEVQEKNNWLLFKALQRDFLAGRELPFGEEVQRLIPKWLESFPVWLQEFQSAREKKTRSKAIVIRWRAITRERYPSASLRKRFLKKRWGKEYRNWPSAAILSAIA